uniref:Uncharacterized protein n=1 Tax=Triticum urartu TaxID=4572 RepID=A0A8R7R593_TRIUA
MGMLPSKLLSPSKSQRREEKFPIKEGMVPERLFDCKIRYCKVQEESLHSGDCLIRPKVEVRNY